MQLVARHYIITVGAALAAVVAAVPVAAPLLPTHKAPSSPQLASAVVDPSVPGDLLGHEGMFAGGLLGGSQGLGALFDGPDGVVNGALNHVLDAVVNNISADGVNGSLLGDLADGLLLSPGVVVPDDQLTGPAGTGQELLTLPPGGLDAGGSAGSGLAGAPPAESAAAGVPGWLAAEFSADSTAAASTAAGLSISQEIQALQQQLIDEVLARENALNTAVLDGEQALGGNDSGLNLDAFNAALGDAENHLNSGLFGGTVTGLDPDLVFSGQIGGMMGGFNQELAALLNVGDAVDGGHLADLLGMF
jgi:hypothetical protein